MSPTVRSPAERRCLRGSRSIRIAFALACVALSAQACRAATGDGASAYDIAILNGRVIDPESATDGVLNVGISGGTIRYVGTDVVSGRETLDARGHVVSPGFIDTDSYPHLARFSVHDGVTSALDLRSGTADVEAWYAEHAGRIVVNLGVSAG